ncbi:MAG: ABC transporter permease [Gemmatimonadota bacterium]|jgi:predicted permease
MSGTIPGDAPRPSWLFRLALGLLPEEERRVVLSELSESWAERAARDGVVAARRWYGRQSRQFVLRLATDRLRPRGGAKSGAGVVRRAGDGVLRELARDLGVAVRGLSRSRLLAGTVVMTVGLGVGASVAMFAVVNTVLIRPLPYRAPDRLVRIYHAMQGNRWPLSVVDWDAIREQQTSFESLAAYRPEALTLSQGAEAERVRAKRVTPGYFRVLGVTPVSGRGFDTEEGEPGGPRSVVLSWRLWQRSFGGDPSILGGSVRLDGAEYVVVGILPAAPGPLDAGYDLFPVLQLDPPTRKGPFFLTLVGRLGAGSTAATTAAELRAINRRLFPVWSSSFTDESASWGLMPLRDYVTGRVARPVLVLLGAVAFVLLVAAANAANLMVARTAQRGHELAVRAALGATRRRIGRLIVAESLVLTVASAALGAALAWVAIWSVRTVASGAVPRSSELGWDSATVLFLTGTVVLAGLAIGLVPALLGTGRTTAGGLRTGSRSVTGGVAAERLRRALVVAEFAVAMPLLAGAGLLVNSFARLQRVDPGFAADGLLTASLTLPRGQYADAPGRTAFWNALIEHVEALPGVRRAAIGSGARPPREAVNSNNFDLLDRPTPPGESQPLAVWVDATPGYFDALGIPLVAGRYLDERDLSDGPWAVVVDAAWAGHNYPDEDPIGKRFYEGGCSAPECAVPTVVGVVGDVRYQGLDDTGTSSVQGTIYSPAPVMPPRNAVLYVRGSGDPLALLPGVRAAVRELDPGLVLFDIASGEQLLDGALRTPRNLLAVVGAFAATALLLAVIGLYGVLAFFVEQHRKEIGIRVALGGSAPTVVRLVLARGMRPVLAGGLIGLAAAVTVTGFMRNILFDVPARDASTFAAVTVAMLLSALVACLIPAARAALLDPVRTLRDE